MISRLRVLALLLVAGLVSAPSLVEAGSGSRPAGGSGGGGGRFAPPPSRGSGGRFIRPPQNSGSGNRPAGSDSKNQAIDFATTIWEYRGKLTKGELDGSEEATISGFFRLEDGAIIAAASPNAPLSGGSLSRFNTRDAVDTTLVAAKADGTTKLGEYRLGRNGRMTLIFMNADDAPAGSGDKKDGSGDKAGSGKKDDDDRLAGSGEKGDLATPSVADYELNGVMVLKRKLRKDRQFWAGSFREKEGKKTIRTWLIHVEPTKPGVPSA